MCIAVVRWPTSFMHTASLTPARIIERNEIDLLVLGTHGRQGLAKMVMGSAAEEIFRRASCPVLTVGPKAAREPGQFENWKDFVCHRLL